MAVHTCTRCPLRFANRAELADHMALDHAEVHLPRPLDYPSSATAAPLYRSLQGDDVHTVLLVANQTLQSDHLAEAIADLRAAHDRLAVVVVVPATPSDRLATAPGGGQRATPAAGIAARTDEAGLAQARWRLRTALAAFAAAGVPARGAVGDPNPVLAVAAAVSAEPIDEIVVSTLDPSTSRWLRADLPRALEHRYHVPVTTLTAMSAAAG